MKYKTYSEKTVSYIVMKMKEGRVRQDDDLVSLMRAYQGEVDEDICNRNEADQLNDCMMQVMDFYHAGNDRLGRKSLRVLKSQLRELEAREA